MDLCCGYLCRDSPQTITQSHQSYARTLSNARPLLSYTTEADPTATHRFQEDADRLLGQWDDLLCLSEKSLEYKQGILAALDNVMKLFAPLNEFLEEGESILGERPRALELETWLASAEVRICISMCLATGYLKYSIVCRHSCETSQATSQQWGRSSRSATCSFPVATCPWWTHSPWRSC